MKQSLVGAGIFFVGILLYDLSKYIGAQVAKDEAEAYAARVDADIRAQKFNNEVRRANYEREQDESDKFFKRGQYAQ